MLKDLLRLKKISNHNSIIVVAVVILVGGLLAIGLGLHGQQTAPTVSPKSLGVISPMSGNTGKQPVGKVLAYSTPVSLTIPVISVNSSLTQVAQNMDGTIEVPAGAQFNEAAWYNASPAPGQYGASIIVGHIDNYKTGPSVFFNLAKLKPGDTITVDRKDRTAPEFVVTAVRQYAKTDFPTAEVYTGNNAAELRLITCGGKFNRRTGHYEENTVVYAKLESKSS